jgi:hypothetical protein
MDVSLSSGTLAFSGPRERRQRMDAVPLNLREFLSCDQRRSIKQIAGFGWQLAFVRRQIFLEPIVVIQNSDGSRLSVLECDGTVNEQPDIRFRQ